MRAILFLLMVGLLGSSPLAAGEAAVKPKFILKGHKDLLRALAFSPDGKLLASGSNDGSIRLWDVVEGKEIRVLGKYGGYGLGLAFTPDGKMIAAGLSKVRLLPVAEGGTEIELPAASFSEGYVLANSEERPFRLSGWSTAPIFSPDGKHMAILKPNSNVFGKKKDPNVKAKPLKDFAEVWKTYEFYDVSRRVKVTLDAPAWAQNGYAKVTPRQLLPLGVSPGQSAYCFSYDSKFLANIGPEGTMLWELEKGNKLVTFPVRHGTMVFSQDGTLLASGGTSGDIYVWDVSKFTKK
jgi:WD40 repeat protein